VNITYGYKFAGIIHEYRFVGNTNDRGY